MGMNQCDALSDEDSTKELKPTKYVGKGALAVDRNPWCIVDLGQNRRINSLIDAGKSCPNNTKLPL